MVMEMPTRDACILVQGVHVIVVKIPTSPHLRLQPVWFSSTLWDKGGRAGRTDFYEGEWDFLLEGSRGVPNWGLNSLGNGTFYSLVSCPCCWKRCAYWANTIVRLALLRAPY